MKLLILLICTFAVSAEETIFLNAEMEPKKLECNTKMPEWYRTLPDDSTELISTETSYTVTVTANSKPGLYECVFNSTTIASYIVSSITDPQLINMRNSITYTEGDHHRKIVCASGNSYPPVKFTWLKKNEEDDDAVRGIVVSPDTNLNINLNQTFNRSTLMFNNLTYDEAGIYECRIENSAGNSSIELTVRVKDKYAALWPFLGIVCEVVILIIIIFIYEKNSKKPSDTPPTLDIKEDEKPLNTNEENGNEMRNRSSVKA